ncbi:MAG: 23S rRNA (uracil(1939)-C(5))-methyltransferase RlmD [Kofleriaceae bacterium]|nr:23S rRNA (uracil(1939)-C(5))-methyltransferase RlmD [Kofleriaceae bacterium]
MSKWDRATVVEGKSIAEDGRGVTEVDGLTLYVAGLLPGERGHVEIEHRSQHKPVAWARLIERVGATSPHRTEPACPAYGVCGGCAWQHLDYDCQLDEKQKRVASALEARLSDLPEIPKPIASDWQTGYRNKGKYVVAEVDGRLTLGAYKPRSHEVVSTLGCQVVEPTIDTTAKHVATHLKRCGIPVYSEKERTSGLRYVLLRCNSKAQVLVTIVCTSDTDTAQMQDLAGAINSFRRVCGVVRCNNNLHSGAILTSDVELLCGSLLKEETAGVTVELDSGSFWQVHRKQAARAYQDIVSILDLPTGSKVMELYAGMGGIAFALAKQGLQVAAVEQDAQAVDAATRAAHDAGLANVEFYHADATKMEPEDFEGITAVVVDPPRKGLGNRGVKQLCEAKVAKIAYLSCGPESLAKDLEQLVAAGYEVAKLKLYDFMPGTAQVEVLALLVLNTSPTADASS